jgi:hypothetical protein
VSSLLAVEEFKTETPTKGVQDQFSAATNDRDHGIDLAIRDAGDSSVSSEAASLKSYSYISTRVLEIAKNPTSFLPQ